MLRLSDPIHRVLRGLLPALAALCASAGLRAATYEVRTTAEFNSLPSTLHAGDVVIIHDGTYGALDRTFTSSIADDATAQENPVRIHAARPGGAVVTGPSRLTLRGRGIVLAGLDFAPGSGGATNTLINLDANSRYMRLNNLRFVDCSPPAPFDDRWIRVQGFHHTIEYCSFVGKRSANVIIAITRATSNEAGPATPRHHVLRYNYFGPREASLTDNGYESIRIGDSSSQIYDLRVVVEQNVFYRSIWRSDGQKPNEPEIISNKSRGNTIRHNTFLESTGQITLRHGDACIVEGNYIFGAGYYSEDGTRILLRPPNTHQAGVRIIGQDHIVRNNYFINLRGTNGRAALCLMGGATVWNDGDGFSGDNGYEPADGAQIYHNTFIDCGEINLGFLDSSAHRVPTGVRIHNNVWQSTVAGKGVVRHSAFNPLSSGGNHVYATGNLGWTGLGGTATKTISPLINVSWGDLLIPAGNSPLLGAADSVLSADLDLRGLPRPASGRDIGAFELEVPGTGSRPLLRHEVGPEYDGGPLGRYPAPGGAFESVAPVITSQPAAQTVAAGATVQFAVEATGIPAPAFQWLHNGSEIGGNTSALTATLVLPAAGAAEAGSYAVLVTNSAGSVTSEPALLTVTGLVDPYATFLSAHGLDEITGAPDADPDGDGLVNLIEFLLGGDPVVADAYRAPQLGWQPGEFAPVWLFTFRIVAGREGVHWLVEHSSDLVLWRPAVDGADDVTITRLPAEDDFEDVTVTFPANGQPLFARIRVERG